MVKKEGDSYGITLAEAQPVFVQKTSKDGPADKAGIQAGDRIVKVCVGVVVGWVGVVVGWVGACIKV